MQNLGAHYLFYSLKSYANEEKIPLSKLSRLPICLRIMLESLIRNFDGKRITKEDILALFNWNAKNPSDYDIPFIVSRVILQDFTGVPLLVDLAAMREAVFKQGKNPSLIEPLVPVDLVVDHSAQVDSFARVESFPYNLKKEFERNQERYAFLKWGQEAFKTFKVVPPGVGIVHQVNLEYFATIVAKKTDQGKEILFPDTLVGTDSHTTMINGMGVLGWGVGGIEAEAAMLGLPVYMQTPEVIGVHLIGQLPQGSTATDLTLHITELLRETKVVGKFVEFFGAGARTLSVADRATIANMAPEYGATIGFFPTDEKTLEYLLMTGRTKEHTELVKKYLKEQDLFGIPLEGEVDYTHTVTLDLNTVHPCIAGPKRPQDRILLSKLKEKFGQIMSAATTEGGYGKAAHELGQKICIHSNGFYPLTAEQSGGTAQLYEPGHRNEWSEDEMVSNRPFNQPDEQVKKEKTSDACDIILEHGSIVIAAITSCTNTSNPFVMIAAGLLAKKAVEKGLRINPKIKTSLAPGSRVVTDYLTKSGLQTYLDQLGFQLVAYGCTTCIGNSGPLNADLEQGIKEYDIIAASVLSGNRNFEARIHSSVKANFLMSPPLVVAFALAGRVDIDVTKEPLSYARNGDPVYLKEIWPTQSEIEAVIQKHMKPQLYTERYAHINEGGAVWDQVKVNNSALYHWESHSTYIRNPPYFDHFSIKLPKIASLMHMRPLALLGDSVTTDHISPAGSIKASTPAGRYLIEHGIGEAEFNSYGSRRGNHDVMMRGTFSNVRMRNFMADKEGGFTKLMPENKFMTIFEASQEYVARKIPLIVLAGKDYGMGSSRDWAAKGTALLGVKAVVAKSFERIHRSNLIGMGVLPLEFMEGVSVESLGLTGDELFSFPHLNMDELQTGGIVEMEILKNGIKLIVELKLRLDTPSEVDYYKHGGIMPYVLRELLSKT